MKNRLAFALALLLTLAAGALAAPPNIVFIISDDQSWTDYGFMGHDVIQTPHLDRLAAESVTFKRGYVPTALCRTSLMTMATGRYAHAHGITGNDPAATSANARHVRETGKPDLELLISPIDKLPTLPKLLAGAGYVSHQSGKWWEGSYKRGGFTHGMTRGYPEKGGRHGDDGLTIGREGLAPIFNFIDMAVEEEKPFLIWYAPFLPHWPHTPPERLLKKYHVDGRPLTVAKYFAMCEWFDETCGQLLGRIDDKGLRDNTLVVYVTDNGWIQLPDDWSYAPRSKRSPYEGGVRTPIMFRWPGVIEAKERPELCSSIDLVPTMLAAAGVEIPQDLPGLNLLPNLKNQTPIERDAVFGEAFAHDVANLMKPEDSLLYRWVIEGNWKLLITYDGRPGQMKYPPTETGPRLYDLSTDPHEMQDLAEAKPAVVRRLSKRIADWWPVTERQFGAAVKDSHVETSHEFNLPAAAVWNLIAGFNTLPDYHASVPASRLSHGGAVRYLTISDEAGGGTVVERLVNYDDEAMTFSYKIIELIDSPMPFRDYQAWVKLKATGVNSCKLYWNSSFNVEGSSKEEAEELARVIYQGCYDGIMRVLTAK
jgi:uncharacterized sulfatase